MNTTRFDDLLLSLSLGGSRRGLLAALAGLSVGLSRTTAEDSAAKNKKKKRKRRKKRKKRPTTREDAFCNAGTASSTSTPGGDDRLAQTFAALASGKLVRAQLALNRGASAAGDYILRLSPVDAFGAPTNTVLATAVVPVDDVPLGISTVTFDFADPASVTAGTFYGLILSQPGTVSFTWMGELFGDCQGRSFFSNSQTAEFEAIGNDWDFTFTTFVSS